MPLVARAEAPLRLPSPPAEQNWPPAEAQPSMPLAEGQAAPLGGWWQSSVSAPLARQAAPLNMSLESVVLGTLHHSAHVRVAADAPLIRQAAVDEAAALFDFRAFMESNFTDVSNPVGNTLTTGGPDRLIEQDASYDAGVRKLTRIGTELEASQQFGYLDNNSVFLVPPQQGNARMAISLTQPLLRGVGRSYNESLVVLAEIDASVAKDELVKRLQEVLRKVHEAYWDLYLQRSVLLQRARLHQHAREILAELEARRQLDVLGSQLARAEAAVLSREAGVIRAEAAVRNAEARLRSLVNDPLLSPAHAVEFVPLDNPGWRQPEVEIYTSLGAALQNRPELVQLSKEIRAAQLRADVSRNDMLPMLDLLVSTYVSGLHGHADLGSAWQQQFIDGRPSYSAGLLFEYPLGNRAARSRREQRLLELRQLTNQLEATMARVRMEVEIATREVETTAREMNSRYHEMRAEEMEVHHIAQRWQMLPADGQMAGMVLDELLDAQDRLAEAELKFASAQVAHRIAHVDLLQVSGSLLRYEAVHQYRTVQSDLPTLWLTQSPSHEAGRQPLPAELLAPPVPQGEAPVPAAGNDGPGYWTLGEPSPDTNVAPPAAVEDSPREESPGNFWPRFWRQDR